MAHPAGRRKLALRVQTVRLPDVGFRQEQRRLGPKSRQNPFANCRFRIRHKKGAARPPRTLHRMDLPAQVIHKPSEALEDLPAFGGLIARLHDAPVHVLVDGRQIVGAPQGLPVHHIGMFEDIDNDQGYKASDIAIFM